MMNPGKWKVNLNHIFMLYKSVETCHPVSLPCKGTSILIFVICGASFYLWVWSVQLWIQSLYAWVWCIHMQRMFCALSHMSSIPMGAINLYMQECFLHLLIWLLYPLGVMYLHARMFCTLSYTSSSIPMGAINFYM